MDLHSIIKTLSQDEKAELVRLLRQDLNVPRIDIIWSAINRDQLILCPHCNIDIEPGIDRNTLKCGQITKETKVLCPNCKKEIKG